MKEFSFIKTSLWVDESFRQMSPEQKLIMLYLLQGTQTNWCGVFKLNISMMGFFLGLREDNVSNAFQAFCKQFRSLVVYDENTSEVAILNWGAMNLVNMNEKSLSAARKDILGVESDALILEMIAASKASKIIEFYTSGLNSIRASRRNSEQLRESFVSQPPLLTDCESNSCRQREIERENKVLLEKEPKISTFPFSEDGSTKMHTQPTVGSEDAAKETQPPGSAAPPSPSWPELLRRKARPPKGFSAAMKPDPEGGEWERRLYVFDAVRRKYPGTKGGLSVEFDWFLNKAHENKIQDIDNELKQMPYAVLYQIKWNEVKNDEGGFVPNWKNFSTWLSKLYWQADMEAWKNRAEWFNQMCSPETKTKVEELKSILTCK